jgi:hypothetical protein
MALDRSSSARVAVCAPSAGDGADEQAASGTTATAAAMTSQRLMLSLTTPRYWMKQREMRRFG